MFTATFSSPPVGIDINPDFLSYAERKIADSGVENATLLRRDINECTRESIGEDPIDIAIRVLGLSVIEDWEKAIDRTFSILNPGGIFVVFDLCIDTRKAFVQNK